MGRPFPGEDAPAPSPPPLAAKADDLEAIRGAVVDAAAVGGGLWLSYLFVLFYLLVAAGGVTHRDLFLESPIKLPFLNIDLPLKGFFWLGPALFLVVHTYVLLHVVLLAGKVGVFDAQLRAQIDDTEVRRRLRRQLPSNVFVQFLAGPPETRYGVMGFLLKLIAWISLVIGPVSLLVFFHLQFLPYHDPWVTWWQRIAVLLDLALLWILWPTVVREEAMGLAWRGTRWGTVIAMACLNLVSVAIIFAIATFPGEWLEEQLRIVPSIPLREALVAGRVNTATRKPESLWSNRIVLPEFDVIDHSQLDTDVKIAAVPTTASFRARHLEGAVLIRAVLRKADFTAAHLEGAQLDSADLRDAKFECARPFLFESSQAISAEDCTQLQGASLGRAQLQGASLDFAQLQGASLRGAQLQGASLDFAQLQGASLGGAQLQGASLNDAQLQGANFDNTELQGASLDGAQLQGAGLSNTRLLGASLDNVHLEGALLVMVQLQGASLRGAQLQSAWLDVLAWRADARAAVTSGAIIQDAKTGPEYLSAATGSEPWSAALLGDLEKRIEQEVPAPRRAQTLARVDPVLDPAKPLKDEAEMAQNWAERQRSSPTPTDYEVELARRWREIGCAADGSPYVLKTLINYMTGTSVFAEGSPQRAQLATEFLKEGCAGASGLAEDDKAKLKALTGSVRH
jgi:uncharacterized protein YjbI with pentapeptide repeats